MSDVVRVEGGAEESAWPEHDIDWRQAVRDVVWIPAPHRVATVPVAAARRALRCTEASFARLVDLGLPSVDGPQGPLYDPTDLKNVGLYSRSHLTEVELSMRLMLSFMQASREELTKLRHWRYRLQLLAAAEPGARVIRRVYRPVPERFGGAFGSYAASVGPPPEMVGPFFRMAQGSEVTGTLMTRGAERVVRSPAIRQVVDELLDSGIRWHALPETFAADPREPTTLGIGNCGTLCAVLQQRLVDTGFEARSYHGWMTTLSEVDHGWVEVLDDDGTIKYLDPSFALLAVGNGFGPRDFRDFVIGSTLNRVVATEAPLDCPYVVDGVDDVVAFSIRSDTELRRSSKARSGLRRSRGNSA